MLYPRKTKTVRYLLGCLTFTVVGIWLAIHGETAGWFCLVIFGLGSLVFAALLIPGIAYLRIHREGFTVHQFRREDSFRWIDVREFRVARIGLNKMVVFDFAEAYDRLPRLRKIVSGLTSAEGALPDSYGLTPEQLAAIMNETKAVGFTRDAG